MNPVTVRAIASIVVRPQHRKHFADDALELLAQSIRSVGVLQPLLVCPEPEGVLLIAGERRLRAAVRAGLSEVPTFTVDLPGAAPGDLDRLRTIENLQREALNPLELTGAIVRCCADALSVAPEAVPQLLRELRSQPPQAEAVQQLEALFSALGWGKWQSFVANRLPLLNMPGEVQSAVASGELPYTVARKIAQVKDPQARLSLLEDTLREDLSGADVQERVKVLKAGALEASPPPGTTPGELQRDFEALSQGDLSRLGVVKRTRLRALLHEAQSLLQGPP